MSLDVSGFEEEVVGAQVIIRITEQHPLVKLANTLPWEDGLAVILPDLQRTEKLWWWVGRPLRVRIHLGIYLLQQLFNLTDRQAESCLHDNAAFRLFCGIGLTKHWHVPDHTKIAAFRSRLLPETQRQLANLIAVQAVRLRYANPAQVDIDSTIQEANISYPSAANLLVKVARLAKRLVEPLNTIKEATQVAYRVSLTRSKALLLHYFTAKRQARFAISTQAFQSLWQEVCVQVGPILKDSYRLAPFLALPKYGHLRRAVEQLQWNGYRLLTQLYEQLFENSSPRSPIYSLHAYDVHCFDKQKLSKKKQYGRVFQLGRIGGHFAIVGACTSIHMPDAKSLPSMLNEHALLFGDNVLTSIAVDKGYYALANQQLLEQKGVQEIGLPRPSRYVNAARNPTPGDVLQKLQHRRAGVEALISHIKHGGQLGRSRMKSDRTTLAAGYAAVLGFNLRQLKRAALGELCPKSQKTPKLPQNPSLNPDNSASFKTKQPE